LHNRAILERNISSNNAYYIIYMCTYSNGTNIDRDQNSEISELCMMIDEKIHHHVIIYIIFYRGIIEVQLEIKIIYIVKNRRSRM